MTDIPIALHVHLEDLEEKFAAALSANRRRGLPDLSGRTPSQIVAGEIIRDRFYSQVDAIIDNYRRLADSRCDPETVALYEKTANNYELALRDLRVKQTRAKWWIECEGLAVIEILRTVRPIGQKPEDD
jgi:hypothetical protein